MKQRTVARWQAKWFMIFLGFGVATSAQAAQWPTHEFVIVNAAPGTPIPYPVASNTGFSGEIVDQVKLMESYLGKVSLHFQNLGFAAPQLERVDGRNGGEAYLVRLQDYSNEETHARYATNAGYLEVDLSRAFENGKVSDQTIEALAHELFHAVQRSYLQSAQLDHGNWIIEGQAQAIGMDTALILEGVDVYKGENDDYRLGGRQYFRPLPTEVHDETYRTASFWRYLAELDATPDEPDYHYLADVFSIPFDGPTSEDADLQWLDMGLRKATGEGLAYHYGHFAATIADYIPSRHTQALSGTTEQASDKWLNRLFGPCPALTLSESAASATTTAVLRKNAARCFKVNVEKSQSGTSQRAASGADFLRRMRGQKVDADVDVDLAVKARSAKRADLEALWLGTAGGENVSEPYIGRDSESYVGYWGFSIPAGKPQTFIISNVTIVVFGFNAAHVPG